MAAIGTSRGTVGPLRPRPAATGDPSRRATLRGAAEALHGSARCVAPMRGPDAPKGGSPEREAALRTTTIAARASRSPHALYLTLIVTVLLGLPSKLALGAMKARTANVPFFLNLMLKAKEPFLAVLDPNRLQLPFLSWSTILPL
jgi:hypothetical protein